jgi:iron complex outermembrane receptor protein
MRTKRKSMSFLSVAAFLVMMGSTGPRAQTAGSAEAPATPERPAQGSIMGTVTTKDSKKPILGAEIEIIGQYRIARSDASGHFTLGDLPPGKYLLSVRATGYGSYSAQVPVEAGKPASVDVVLDVQFHEEKLIVTASVEARDPLQVYQPTDVMGAKELEQRAAVSLGQTLSNEPGVSQTGLTPAAGRPVIRGFGGDRVLILEDGLRVGDVSSISPDHGVASDPAGADQIEIVRGPANLLYGSNAIGGVINILGNEVPLHLHEKPTGSLLLLGGSNASEVSATADVEAAAGPVGFRVGGGHREADEFDFKGGTAGNSQYDTDTAHAGVSFVRPGGMFGVAYRSWEADYGIPVDDAGGAVPPGAPGVTIGMKQHSFKARGEVDKEFGPFKAARFEAVSRSYDHTEFEDDGTPGTKFNLDTTEVRVDVSQKVHGRWNGSFGLWNLDQDFSAVGSEVLVPKARTKGYAGFVYEELAYDKVRYLAGARFESVKVDQAATGIEKSFDLVSAALGTIVKLSEPLSLSANLTSSAKAPSAEELFADGPHVATFAFEQGDATLGKETSLGLDLSLKLRTKRLGGELTFFKTRFSDFIFLTPTGVLDPSGSGLFISQYGAADADFTGFELHGDLNMREHFILEILADSVRAENTAIDEPLPRITPTRVGAGLRYETDSFFVAAEARAALRQDRVAPFETETGGYTIYNLYGGITLAGKGILHRIGVRLENLSDKLYRNHISPIKDVIPQQGRNIQLTYRLLF